MRSREGSVPKDASFRTYLFTIARNELHRLLRTRMRKDDKLDFELSSIAQLVSTPGTKIARNQEHQQLVEALRQLPVDQQTLLELHYWEDMDIAGLAQVFDAPTATIRDPFASSEEGFAGSDRRICSS